MEEGEDVLTRIRADACAGPADLQALRTTCVLHRTVASCGEKPSEVDRTTRRHL